MDAGHAKYQTNYERKTEQFRIISHFSSSSRLYVFALRFATETSAQWNNHDWNGNRSNENLLQNLEIYASREYKYYYLHYQKQHELSTTEQDAFEFGYKWNERKFNFKYWIE